MVEGSYAARLAWARYLSTFLALVMSLVKFWLTFRSVGVSKSGGSTSHDEIGTKSGIGANEKLSEYAGMD